MTPKPHDIGYTNISMHNTGLQKSPVTHSTKLISSSPAQLLS